MSKKIINVKSESQKGGITAGIINFNKVDNLKENKGVWANPYFKYLLIPIAGLLIGSGIIWGMTKMFGKEEDKAKEIYHVKSDNQQGGLTAGKIENLNIFTDKESLGIREPDGLYQDGKKVGKVVNFSLNESAKTFTISQVYFDQPLKDQHCLETL